MNYSFNCYASTKQSSRQVIYIGNGYSTVPATPSRAILLLGPFHTQYVCSRINLPTELCHAICIYPIDTLPVAICLIFRCKAQWRTAFSNIIQPLTKGLRHFCRVQPPIFYFLGTKLKATFWGALLGNNQGLSRLCLTMACILCLVYICFTMVSLIFCVIKCLPMIIFLFDASPLIAVVHDDLVIYFW